MSTKIYYIMMWIWAIWWLILYFQNTINSVTLYSPLGTKVWSVIILYSLLLWFITWFGASWITWWKKESDDYEDEWF